MDDTFISVLPLTILILIISMLILNDYSGLH